MLIGKKSAAAAAVIIKKKRLNPIELEFQKNYCSFSAASCCQSEVPIFDGAKI